MKQSFHHRLRGKPLLGLRPLSVSLLLSLVVVIHSVSSLAKSFDEESVLELKRPPVYKQGREQALKSPKEGNEKPNDELLLSLIQKYAKKNSAEKHHKLSSHKLDETRRGSELASVKKTRAPRDIGSKLKKWVDGKEKPFFSLWPWNTGVVILSRDHAIGLICSAAIISPLTVLTSAYCLKEDKNKDEIGVVIEDHNIPKYEGPEQVYKIKEIIVHEDYYNDNITIENDIALLRLSKEVEFNGHINPICLPNDKSDDVKDGTRCVATGLGKTESTAYSRVLNQVNVTVISNSECHEPDNKICVRYPEDGKDTFEGGSGGQLVCLSEGRWKLFGLSSSGPKPGVFKRVVSYIDWIHEIIEQHG